MRTDIIASYPIAVHAKQTIDRRIVILFCPRINLPCIVFVAFTVLLPIALRMIQCQELPMSFGTTNTLAAIGRNHFLPELNTHLLMPTFHALGIFLLSRIFLLPHHNNYIICYLALALLSSTSDTNNPALYSFVACVPTASYRNADGQSPDVYSLVSDRGLMALCQFQKRQADLVSHHAHPIICARNCSLM